MSAETASKDTVHRTNFERQKAISETLTRELHRTQDKLSETELNLKKAEAKNAALKKSNELHKAELARCKSDSLLINTDTYQMARKLVKKYGGGRIEPQNGLVIINGLQSNWDNSPEWEPEYDAPITIAQW